jgi:hypothetical protein
VKESELVEKVKSAPNTLRVTFLEEHPSRDGGVDRFYALLVKLNDYTARYESFCVRVYDKGTDTEVAYFRDGMPSVLAVPIPTPLFIDELRQNLAKIKDQIKATRISITRVDNEQGFAIIEAFSKPADKMVSSQYFVYKDDQGNWVVEPM